MRAILIRERRSGAVTRFQAIAYGTFVVLVTLVIASIAFESVTQACGQVF